MILTRIMVCEIITVLGLGYWLYFVITEKLLTHKKVLCKITVPNRSKETFH